MAYSKKHLISYILLYGSCVVQFMLFLIILLSGEITFYENRLFILLMECILSFCIMLFSGYLFVKNFPENERIAYTKRPRLTKYSHGVSEKEG